MANIFQVGETVICSITVKDSSGTAQDPITSMKITINRTNPNWANVLAATAMTDDAGVGAYHYDYSTSSAQVGEYEIIYTAVDGTRTTIQKDTFILE